MPTSTYTVATVMTMCQISPVQRLHTNISGQDLQSRLLQTRECRKTVWADCLGVDHHDREVEEDCHRAYGDHQRAE